MLRGQFISVYSLLFLFIAASPLQADDVQQRIFEDNLKRAEAGDSNAQFIVAHRYEIGVGTEKDTEKAYQWYRKAAEKGHPLAARKVEERNEAETEKRAQENAARKKAEQQRAEAQSRADAEARKKAEQLADAARKRKAADAPAARNAAVVTKPAMAVTLREDTPVAPRHAATPAPSEPALNPMDIVLGSLWQQNQHSAEILPSPNTSCLRTATAEITCFTGESHQQSGPMRVSYTVKSVLTRFARDGSFQVRYVYNVTELNKSGDDPAAANRIATEIKPVLGWQEPGFNATCRAGSEHNIQCTTDRKVVMQFTKM